MGRPGLTSGCKRKGRPGQLDVGARVYNSWHVRPVVVYTVQRRVMVVPSGAVAFAHCVVETVWVGSAGNICETSSSVYEESRPSRPHEAQDGGIDQVQMTGTYIRARHGWCGVD